MAKISCIIPAYNEGARIGNVLNAVAGHPLISEVIVVDDGSSDNTREVVRKYSGVKLIEQRENKGKSKAIHTAITNSSGDILFMLDADLIGLTPEDISKLVEPVNSGEVTISMSLRKVTPVVDLMWKMAGLDYCSGERVFPKSILENHLNEIQTIDNFGLEVFINRIIIKNQLKIKIVDWDNVSTPTKSAKRGTLAGIKAEIKMMSDILKTIPIYEIPYQIYKLRKLRK